MATTKGKAKSGKKIQKLLPLSLKMAQRLRALRKAKGYTSAELFAFENGFNRSQYISYERGVDLRASSLERLCKAHGITLAEFFSEGFE